MAVSLRAPRDLVSALLSPIFGSAAFWRKKVDSSETTQSLPPNTDWVIDIDVGTPDSVEIRYDEPFTVEEVKIVYDRLKAYGDIKGTWQTAERVLIEFESEESVRKVLRPGALRGLINCPGVEVKVCVFRDWVQTDELESFKAYFPSYAKLEMKVNELRTAELQQDASFSEEEPPDCVEIRFHAPITVHEVQVVFDWLKAYGVVKRTLQATEVVLIEFDDEESVKKVQQTDAPERFLRACFPSYPELEMKVGLFRHCVDVTYTLQSFRTRFHSNEEQAMEQQMEDWTAKMVVEEWTATVRQDTPSTEAPPTVLEPAAPPPFPKAPLLRPSPATIRPAPPLKSRAEFGNGPSLFGQQQRPQPPPDL